MSAVCSMALNYLFLTLHLLSVVPNGCAQDDTANRNTPGTCEDISDAS